MAIKTIYLQGDVCVARLTDEEAAKLDKSRILKSSARGELRLLEGEITGHHHVIESPHRNDEMEAEAIAVTALALAKARAALDAESGIATLYMDAAMTNSLGWLARPDMLIGWLVVERAPVNLAHPEHSTIMLPVGTYYVGRQIESAGAEERVVQD